MAKLHLSLACGVYDRTRALLEGAVNPEGIELTYIPSHPPDTFYRIVRYNEFDVSEMSISTLIMLASRSRLKWKAIPVFPMRYFFPQWSFYNIDSGVDKPEHLKGKRVGVPEYQMTAALWNRGILQHEYGVKPEDMEWFEERTEDRVPYERPKNCSFRKIPPGKSIASMLVQGEISAAIVYLPKRTLVDRSGMSFVGHPKVKPLFPEPKKALTEYFRKTGMYPINHTIVIKEEILKAHPWVAVNLYTAFTKSKEICYQQWRELGETPSSLIWVREAWEEQKEIFGEDPFPYGLRDNRKIIETMIEYSFEQGLSKEKVQPEGLFAETTLDL